MIKIDIVTGFLGAGKTTFVSKMLTHAKFMGEKAVFVVNEFGKTGIDSDMVESSGYKVFEMTNGCICCSLKEDFKLVIEKIINDLKPDRIIFEPSGIFILSEIFDILKPYRQVKINNIICIVDSMNNQLFRQKYNFYLDNQLASSNFLIISKLTSDSDSSQIVCDLALKNPEAKIISLPWDELNAEEMQAIMNSEEGWQSKLELEEKLKHPLKWNTMSFKPSEIISKEELFDFLDLLKSGKHGEVVRAKGYVKSHDGTLLFNLVGDNYTIEPAPSFVQPRITVIGQSLSKEIPTYFSR